MQAPKRFYTEYDRLDPIINNRGWEIYDRQLTYGNGDPMPLAICWKQPFIFEIS